MAEARPTPWFPVHSHPRADRPGIYKTRSTVGVEREPVTYRWWDGSQWGRCMGSRKEAASAREPSPFQPEHIEWCGVLDQPKETKASWPPQESDALRIRPITGARQTGNSRVVLRRP